MTPYQLRLYVEEENKKEEARAEEMMRMAYLQSVWISRFVWMKKVPAYEELNKKEKEMTPEEMLEQIKQFNLAFGGTEVK